MVLVEESVKLRSGVWHRFVAHVKPNRALLPVKAAMFLYSASAFCILPYLTIHMKDIGITVGNIAIIYAILPFVTMFTLPIVGFLADKLGSYTRVLLLMLVGNAAFHSLLLAVPTVVYVESTDMTFQLNSSGVTTFAGGENCRLAENAVELGDRDLTLNDCHQTCNNEATKEALCEIFDASLDGLCTYAENEASLILSNSTLVTLDVDGDKNATGSLFRLRLRHGPLDWRTHDGCVLSCEKISGPQEWMSQDCNDDSEVEVSGNVALTTSVYFVLRSLATICLGCCFVLFDAQAMETCNQEEVEGRKGELGRNYISMILAQAIVSPLVGQLIDVTSRGSSKPNYIVAFAGNAIFLALTFLTVWNINLKFELPKSTGLRGLGRVFRDVDICVFLFMVFVLGSCWGFIETFLFVYLKEDMAAPMYVLGLTITVGAVVSLPFIYMSDWLVEKIGLVNVFIVGLLTFGVRYIGYSFITNPMMAFPFEALELFTNNLTRVAWIKYVGIKAPKGLLATLNGVVGGLHYGFGKGSGSLLGGAIIAATGSTATAFRWFGYGATGFGVLYFVYEYFLARLCRSNDVSDDHESADEVEEFRAAEKG